jgi:hypothetical protein
MGKVPDAYEIKSLAKCARLTNAPLELVKRESSESQTAEER